MVRKRKSGKFVTEIRDPFSKKKIWLGTFNTAEEASEVYQSKKLEFQEKLNKAKNANKKKAIPAKCELGLSSSDPPLMADAQTSDSSNELDDRSKKAENAIVKKAITAKFGLEFCSSDTPTSDSSNELDDQSKNAENAIVKEAISAKFELGNSSSDPSSTVDSQTSDSSNDQESEEEL
ncbi:Ethylene-responsive transcription factor [Capsicum chinense]|nr:Ethylene-responsive transcription factor [Capsicum chinense]